MFCFVCFVDRLLGSDEVSTGSGSDRVIVLPTLTVTWLDDPVATAPGTDLIAQNIF
jgi:hypothetical protein